MCRGERLSRLLASCFVASAFNDHEIAPAGADAPTLHRFQGWLDEARSRQLRPDPSEREERGDLVLILTAEVNWFGTTRNSPVWNRRLLLRPWLRPLMALSGPPGSRRSGGPRGWPIWLMSLRQVGHGDNGAGGVG